MLYLLRIHANAYNAALTNGPVKYYLIQRNISLEIETYALTGNHTIDLNINFGFRRDRSAQHKLGLPVGKHHIEILVHKSARDKSGTVPLHPACSCVKQYNMLTHVASPTQPLTVGQHKVMVSPKDERDSETMIFIHLGHDNFTVIDDEDWPLVSNIVFSKDHAGYATKTSDTISPRNLHIILLGKQPRGYEIDHINGIKHDNRRINLRIVSCSENRRNVPNKRGTYCDRHTGKWWAHIRINNKKIYLGYGFNTEEEAHDVYVARSKLLPVSFFGEKPAPPPLPTEEEKRIAIEHRQQLKQAGRSRIKARGMLHAKPVTNNIGEVFEATKLASRTHNIPIATLIYWLTHPHSKGNTLGWRYINEINIL